MTSKSGGTCAQGGGEWGGLVSGKLTAQNAPPEKYHKKSKKATSIFEMSGLENAGRF